jgi:hypothetical protein
MGRLTPTVTSPSLSLTRRSFGDTLWNGVYPFINYSTGGHIDGMIRGSWSAGQ